MTQFLAPNPVRHKPVMLAEVLKVLRPAKGMTYLDATFGAGGYTRAILEAAECKVVALDRDPVAIAGGQPLVKEFAGRLALVHATFSQMKSVVAAHGLSHVDGIVMDVGVSSMQIDEAQRGFSFMREGPLDMRMSNSGSSAADAVNGLDASDLSRVIFVLGEEPRARAIARAIVRAREIAPLTTTTDLVRAIERATGPQRAKERTHPATRTFQALRIYVNNELGELAEALIAAEEILGSGGCLAVVTFHSLEDRIVKRFFTLRSGKAPSASRHQPEVPARGEPGFILQQRGHLDPQEQELRDNPRARSAKLRYGLRTEAQSQRVDFAALGVPGLELEAGA